MSFDIPTSGIFTNFELPAASEDVIENTQNLKILNTEFFHNFAIFPA